MKAVHADQRIVATFAGSRVLVLALAVAISGLGFATLAFAQEESAGQEGSSAAPAEEQQQQETTSPPPDQNRLGVKKDKRTKAKSLSDLAAQIKLKKPSEDEGSLVISNRELSKSSGGGTISYGGTLAGGSSPDAPPEAKPKEISPEQQRVLDEQQSKVQELQRQKEQLERMLEIENNPYTNSGAHYRPGGIQSTTQVERDRVARELEAENAKLEKMKRRADRRRQ